MKENHISHLGRSFTLIVCLLSIGSVLLPIEAHAEKQNGIQSIPAGQIYTLHWDGEIGGVSWDWSITDYDYDDVIFTLLIDSVEEYRYETMAEAGRNSDSGERKNFESGKTVQLQWQNDNSFESVTISYTVEGFASPEDEASDFYCYACCGVVAIIVMVVIGLIVYFVFMKEKQPPVVMYQQPYPPQHPPIGRSW